MSEEEIDYWLKLFSDNNHTFMSKDGKKITLFKVFDKLKELQQKNQELKKQLHEASIEMQEMIEQDIECPSNCSKLKDLDKIEKSFIEIKNQQKEFIEYTNKTIVELECIDTFKEILSKYKEIIGSDINVGSKGGKE